MFATPLEQRLRAMIAPSVEAMGYAVVLVHLGDGRRKTLRVVAERKDGRGMGVEDCTTISHTVSALLDVEDPIKGGYDLEVSSPGMDRPLTSAEDFKRFKGRMAKLETQLPIEGRKRFKGEIGAVTEKEVTLVMQEGEARIAMDNIRTAKLAPTDADFRAAMKEKVDER